MNIIPHEKAVRANPASANFVLAPMRPPSSLNDRGGTGSEMRRGRGVLSIGGGVGVTPGGRIRVTMGAGVDVTPGGRVRVTMGVTPRRRVRVTMGAGVDVTPAGGVAAKRAAAAISAGVVPNPPFILKLLLPR
jgi:hypothetical protein